MIELIDEIQINSLMLDHDTIHIDWIEIMINHPPLALDWVTNPMMDGQPVHWHLMGYILSGSDLD